MLSTCNGIKQTEDKLFVNLRNSTVSLKLYTCTYGEYHVIMRNSWAAVIIFGAFIILVFAGIGQGEVITSKEKQLIKHLLGKYDSVGRLGRPVNESEDKLTVEFGLTLVQILDLDERNQVLTTNVWGNYRWKDGLLSWKNMKQFANISSVRVPRQKIWMPDIMLYNYADERLTEVRDALAVVYSEGTVLWVPQAVYKSSCSIDITFFPFDEQECYMKFGSWTYDGDKLDVEFFENNTGFDLADYIASNEWEIVEHSARKNVKYYVCCPEPYPDLRFTLKLRRKVAFYNYILILPCVLLSSLTLVLFWLPPESPAKMQLGMNIFVAFFVLLLLLAESTPPAASSIPLIGAYYCLNMILITLSTFLSVVVVNLYFHGNRSRVPLFVKKIMINVMARILCMHSQVKHVSTKADKNPLHENDSKEKAKYPPFVYDQVGREYELQKEDKWRLVSNGPLNQGLDSPQSTLPTSPMKAIENLEIEVRDIRRYVVVMANRITEKESKDYIGREWKVVALVLDRIFFFIYLGCIIVSVFTMFPKAKDAVI